MDEMIRMLRQERPLVKRQLRRIDRLIAMRREMGDYMALANGGKLRARRRRT